MRPFDPYRDRFNFDLLDAPPRDDFEEAEAACAARLIEAGLAEDLGEAGDVTSRWTVPESLSGTAELMGREGGILCGAPIARLLAERYDLSLVIANDGQIVAPDRLIGQLSGPLRSILLVERTLLNFLQRLSGIASLTSRYVLAVVGTKARILDTRKTTPGWRALEKYAVRCGRGENHRAGLHDAVLIKDNHLAALGRTRDPIGLAVGRSRREAPAGMVVEVEVDTLAQLDFALAARADIVLVDNFPLDALAEAVRRRDRVAPEVLLEASGGVSLRTVRAIAETGVDRISVGALTHSAPALDIGLDFETDFELPND